MDFQLFSWLELLGLFLSYPWIGQIQLYGLTYDSSTLPWWYAFAWIPVMLHPIVFAALIVGLVTYIRSHRRCLPGLDFPVTAFGNPMRISFHMWIFLVTFLSFAAILGMQPVLYTEERHILFLYPPLLLLGALGVSTILSQRMRFTLAGLCTVCSMWSYMHWQEYSYMYKSAIVSAYDSDDFDGEYWALCINQAAADLPDLFPGQRMDVLTFPPQVGYVQLQNLQNGFSFAATAQSVPFISIESERYGSTLPSFSTRELDAGRAKLVDQILAPDQTVICRTYIHHEIPDDVRDDWRDVLYPAYIEWHTPLWMR